MWIVVRLSHKYKMINDNAQSDDSVLLFFFFFLFISPFRFRNYMFCYFKLSTVLLLLFVLAIVKISD